LAETGVSLDWFNATLGRCVAARKVIVLDACHSGAVEGRKDAGQMTAAFRRRVFEEAKGRIVLSSCALREASHEWKEQGHGVFTYYLLEALGGAADRDNDRLVTADEAARYTCEKVKEWAYQHNRKQNPQREYYAVSGDIVLACRPAGTENRPPGGRNVTVVPTPPPPEATATRPTPPTSTPQPPVKPPSAPSWAAGLTPSKLGWGPDNRAYPDKSTVNPKDGAEMVWVPPGSFMMGSEDGESDEKPVHQVTLDGYWLYRTEVTNGQFGRFAQSSGRQIEGDWKGYTARGENHPVVCVTWNDAKAYAEWAGVALPTEAQWEYGARGPEARKYPWGNEWDAKKCCNAESKGQGNPPTFPVGSFPTDVSWCGALDLAGNVWEWCADWYGPYEAAAARNPPGSNTGSARLLRGGSWAHVRDCRSASRFRYGPGGGDFGNGFRGAVSSK